MSDLLIFDDTGSTCIEGEPMGSTNGSGSLNDLLKREQRRILEQGACF